MRNMLIIFDTAKEVSAKQEMFRMLLLSLNGSLVYLALPLETSLLNCQAFIAELRVQLVTSELKRDTTHINYER